MSKPSDSPRIPGTLYKINFNSKDICCFCVPEKTLKLISRSDKEKIVTYLGKFRTESKASILEFEELFLFEQQVGFFICTNNLSYDPINRLLVKIK